MDDQTANYPTKPADFEGDPGTVTIPDAPELVVPMPGDDPVTAPAAPQTDVEAPHVAE